MSRLRLLDGCFRDFIVSKLGGSCHLGIGLRASPAVVLNILYVLKFHTMCKYLLENFFRGGMIPFNFHRS